MTDKLKKQIPHKNKIFNPYKSISYEVFKKKVKNRLDIVHPNNYIDSSLIVHHENC